MVVLAQLHTAQPSFWERAWDRTKELTKNVWNVASGISIRIKLSREFKNMQNLISHSNSEIIDNMNSLYEKQMQQNNENYVNTLLQFNNIDGRFDGLTSQVTDMEGRLVDISDMLEGMDGKLESITDLILNIDDKMDKFSDQV